MVLFLTSASDINFLVSLSTVAPVNENEVTELFFPMNLATAATHFESNSSEPISRCSQLLQAVSIFSKAPFPPASVQYDRFTLHRDGCFLIALAKALTVSSDSILFLEMFSVAR